MILATLVLLAVAAALWRGGGELALFGFRKAGQLVQMVWLRLLFGFVLGGLVQVLFSHAMVAKWIGPASGVKGILIGSYTSMILPGGPYVSLPIIAAIYRAGAGVGPVIALLTGQAMLMIQGLIIWQIPFLGVGIPLARYIVCLFIPPFVGLVGGAVFRAITK